METTTQTREAENIQAQTAMPVTESVSEPAKKAPRKKKREKEHRRVKGLSPMAAMIPFIMVDRVGSQNFITDTVDIEKLEK